MFHKHSLTLLLTLAIALLAGPVSAGTDESLWPAGAATTSDVVRTLVYRDITAPTDEKIAAGLWSSPVLSDDGTTAIYAITRSDGPDGAKQSHVYLIAVDGGEPREVDAVPGGHETLRLDLAADGSRVLVNALRQAGGPTELRLAGGGGARTVVADEGTRLWQSALAGDGRTVYFELTTDTSLAGVGAVEGGIWAVDADGSNLRQIVGREAVAAATGAAPDDEIWFEGGYLALDASFDGSRVIFGVTNRTQKTVRLLGVGGDGSGLHPLGEPVRGIRRGALSGDGAMVLSLTRPGAVSEGYELAVSSFDGTERQVLLAVDATGYLGVRGTMLNEDGSLALLGGGLLSRTDGGGVVDLGVGCGGVGLVVDVLHSVTMDARGERFLYLSTDYYPAPLSLLELDPPHLPIEAPEIADAGIDPSLLAPSDGTTATVSAAVTATDPSVCASLLPDGLPDSPRSAGYELRDGGGDVTAGDGVYTSSPLAITAEVDGPITVRIKAAIQTADGRRYATAVDVGTPTVVAG